MSDILTRLLLDTKGFDSNLMKAKKSAETFSSSITGKLGGAVTKLAGGLGVAMSAAEAFDRVIKGSQTTGDKFAETMEGMKAGVSAFFTAISTGDFTSFNDGLSTIVSRAREAYRALDQLGNAQMSFDIAQTMNQAEIANAMQLAKNKFAPTDVRVGAFGDWKSAIEKQEAQSAQLASDVQEYIAKAVESAASIEGFSANMDNVMKALLLDIEDKAKRDALKSQYAAEYSTFQTEMKDALKAKNKASVGKNPWDRERMMAEQAYNAKVKELTEKYNKAITINALLVRYKDEELKTIGGHVKNMYQLDNATANLKRKYNETANEFNNANKNAKGFNPIAAFEGYKVYTGTTSGGKVGGAASKTEELVAGSIAAIDAEIRRLQQEYANTASDAARMAAAKAIDELQRKKGVIELQARVAMPSVGNGKSGSLAALAGGLPTTLGSTPLSISKEEIKNTTDYAGAINSVANALTAVSTATGEGAAAFLSWASSVMTATAQAVQAIHTVVAAKTAEAAASAGASAASTPVVGWLMIGGAIAAALAAFTKIPKFADGGIVGGSSYFGDKLLARVNSGEAVLTQSQQARALSLMNGSNVRVSGDVRLSGKDIYISLRNYMSSSGNKL